MRDTQKRRIIGAFYEIMNDHYGDLHWWPAETPFEVIVGAILTQNTAWSNVEAAITNMKKAGMLSPARLLAGDEQQIAELIRPSGYFNVKTRRLKSFVRYLMETYHGNLELMFAREMRPLREDLLGINGIGDETADSILLYAGGKAIFVVDAYTKRIMLRHEMIDEHAGYEEIQAMFMRNLPRDAGLFNQYHALIVQVGKDYCSKKEPRCSLCPLKAVMYGKGRA